MFTKFGNAETDRVLHVNPQMSVWGMLPPLGHWTQVARDCSLRIPELFRSDAFHLRRYTNVLPLLFFYQTWNIYLGGSLIGGVK